MSFLRLFFIPTLIVLGVILYIILYVVFDVGYNVVSDVAHNVEFDVLSGVDSLSLIRRGGLISVLDANHTTLKEVTVEFQGG